MIWVDATETPSAGATSLHTRPLLLPPRLTAPAAAAAADAFDKAALPAAADIHAAAANAVDTAAVPDTSAAIPAAASAAPSAAVSAAVTAAETHAALLAARTLTLGGTDITPVVENASHCNNLGVQASAGKAAASPLPEGAVHQMPSTSSKDSILPFQAPALPIGSLPKGRDTSTLPFNTPTLLTPDVAKGRLDLPQGAQHGQLPHAIAASGAQLTCHSQQEEQAQQAKRAQKTNQVKQAEQAKQGGLARQVGQEQQAKRAKQAEQAQHVDQLPEATARMQQQAIMESSRHLIGVLGSDSPISNQPSDNSLTHTQLDSQVTASQQKKRKAVHAAGGCYEYSLCCTITNPKPPLPRYPPIPGGRINTAIWGGQPALLSVVALLRCLLTSDPPTVSCTVNRFFSSLDLDLLTYKQTPAPDFLL